MHGWTWIGNSGHFPPLKSICEAGLSENATQPVLESKTVAESSLLTLWDLISLDRFSSCERKTAPCFKQPFGAQQAGCHVFLSSFLPALPPEAALSHPLRHSQKLLLRLLAPNPCAHSLAAHFASFSLKVRARTLPVEFNRGQKESACRDSGNKANGRSGE